MAVISLVALVLCLIPAGYWFLLALGSVRQARRLTWQDRRPEHRFLIAIPAHDEERVIARTVQRLRELDYPSDLYAIHIVADHCSDATAALARQAGAVVHERNEGPRSGKGAALSWLFQRLLATEPCDAIVIFDSDTWVDTAFLRAMDARLAQGAAVIQGQHIIRNPDSGWFAALTWAMFIIDNRFQNLGRANCGWSAKHMGDSICFRAEVLRSVGWGEGLTEDYQLRQRLLLAGIRIAYEPLAKGYGEAPQRWSQAQTQRKRWLRGTHDASSHFARHLLVEGVRRRDAALLEGAVQAYFPSYSTLTLISVALLAIQLLVNVVLGPVFPPSLLWAWGGLVGALFIYPYVGLALERAPLRAYAAVSLGPLYVVLRSWMALSARYSRQTVAWVRTPHGEEQ